MQQDSINVNQLRFTNKQIADLTFLAPGRASGTCLLRISLWRLYHLLDPYHSSGSAPVLLARLGCPSRSSFAASKLIQAEQRQQQHLALASKSDKKYPFGRTTNRGLGARLTRASQGLCVGRVSCSWMLACQAEGEIGEGERTYANYEAQHGWTGSRI